MFLLWFRKDQEYIRYRRYIGVPHKNALLKLLYFIVFGVIVGRVTAVRIKARTIL